MLGLGALRRVSLNLGRLERCEALRLKYTAPKYEEIITKGRLTNMQKTYKSRDRINAHVDVLKLKNKEKLEEKNDLGTELFNDFTTLEAQMQSLKTKGFLRAYKSYTPPSNLKELFLSTCSSSLGRNVAESSLSTDILDNVEVKFKVLNALSQAFNHSVHNSRLTEIKTLADALLYYQSEVNSKNPYEMLHQESEKGLLPPNLHVQLHPVRFTGKGDHVLDQVTAFPRTSTIVSGLQTRDKIPSLESEFDPYEDLDYK